MLTRRSTPDGAKVKSQVVLILKPKVMLNLFQHLLVFSDPETEGHAELVSVSG